MTYDPRVLKERADALVRLENRSATLRAVVSDHDDGLLDAYRAGCSLRQIAAASGFSVARVRGRLQKLGEPVK